MLHGPSIRPAKRAFSRYGWLQLLLIMRQRGLSQVTTEGIGLRDAGHYVWFGLGLPLENWPVRRRHCMCDWSR